MPDKAPAAPGAEGRRQRFGDLGTAIGLLIVAWTWVLASFPLKDNSFLTHLATGRIILDEGSVPSTDPYTFTAQGVDWTVQSWLASVIYAVAEQVGGDAGLRILVLVMFGVAGALLWRLSAPADSILVRISIVTVALIVASDVWSERPYMAGVIGLSIVWLALDGAVRPWVLVPVLWLWANTHGSFPLALLLVLSVLAGQWLDRRRSAHSDTGSTEGHGHALAVLRAVAVGTLVSAIGPLGPRVLIFPLKSFTQSDVFSEIVEWGAPTFEDTPERAFLLLVLAAIAAVTRLGTWRHAVPLIVFVGAGLVAQRNITMALMVIVPVLAAAAPSMGTLTGRSRLPIGPALTAVAAALVLMIGYSSLEGSVTALDPYPERAVAWQHAADPDRAAGNTATPDFVGNLLEVLDGAEGVVFVDDRADMFPSEFFADTRAVARGEARWSAVLDDYDIDVLLWPRTSQLTSLAAEDDAWRVIYADTESVVACRRGAGCEALEA